MLLSMESQLIHVKSFNKKGWGVGVSGKAQVEIPGALPSEEVEAELGRSRRGKCRGKLRQVVTPAISRVEPRCRHVPECGGCVWQQMDYEAQLKIKQEQLQRLFGGMARPIIRCETPWQYRNKMEFSFSRIRLERGF